MAQMKPVIQYTEDDGLAGNIVHDIAKDQNGILWIATESGISKFDGENFKNIYKSDGLPSNIVWAIEVDDRNTVYAGCYKRGLAVIRHDSVVNTLHTDVRYPDSFRRLLYSRHYKRLFAGTNFGLFMLCDSSLVPVIFPKDIKKKASVMSIVEYGSRIFFTTETPKSEKCGLYELFPDTINPEESYAVQVSNNGKNALAIMNDTIYSTEYYRIYTNPLERPEKQNFSAIDSKFFIWTMVPVSNSKLLMGGYWDERFTGNVLLYDTKKKKVLPTPYPLKIQTVYDIYPDTSKNITWLASDKGLTSLFDSPFEFYEFNDKGNILDIGFAGDSLMVLTRECLYYLDDNILVPVLTKQQIFQKISEKRGKMVARYADDLKIFLEISPAFELTKLYSKGNQLYVCSVNGAISVPDLKSYFPFGGGTFLLMSENSAYAHLKYMNMSLYCSFADSIEKDFPRLYRSYVTDVFKIIESEETIYFATTYNGLIAKKGETVSSLTETNSVIENNLTDIEKDLNGNVWCSSANGNLYQIDFADSLRVVKSLSPATSGIIGNICKWLYFNDKYLFVSTDKGLNIVSLESLYSDNPQIEHFYNNFNGYDFISAHSPVRDKNGIIYLSTANKIIKFKAEFPHAENLEIEIRNVLINKTKSSVDLLFDNALPYSKKNISFDFFVVKFPGAKNLNYSYKVNNGEWVSSNKINLQSLRPGRYEILMNVLDEETNRSFSKTVRIIINSPFWLTWWFLALVTISVALLFFLIMKMRINRLKRYHEEKSALILRNSELKLRSLQLQMSPHFIFNALTSVQKFIMTKSAEEALTYLGNLASIIRTNLENAAEEYIHLSYEIDFLKKYVEIEKMRFKDKLEAVFTTNVGDDNIMLPPMLVQPVIENSIKHGIRNLEGNGVVKVDFAYKSDILVVTIEDNGVGRGFTQSLRIPGHKSLGLNVIRQRLDLLNEKTSTSVNRLEVTDLMENGVPSGTKVTLYLSVAFAV